MDTKKVIPTITDVDTGEILYQLKEGEGQYFCYKTFRIGDFGSVGEMFCKDVYDCFIRGVRQGRNLSLTITIRDFELPVTPNLF